MNFQFPQHMRISSIKVPCIFFVERCLEKEEPPFQYFYVRTERFLYKLSYIVDIHIHVKKILLNNCSRMCI